MQESTALRSVVISGASSGIGHAAAVALAARGYRVFAGVRRPADAEALRTASDGRVEPVALDVTDRASIRAVREQIEERTGEAGLYAIVNNAGVNLSGPLELIAMERIRQQFEVNVFGVIAMVQELLPLVRRARGRIVNIGSIGGLLAVPLQGPYCASKFALEGLSDSLRRELQPFGVAVSLIEPGSIDTAIWDKGLHDAQSSFDALPEAERALYADVAERSIAAARKTAARAVPPSVVTARIVHALEARRPRARYTAGADAAFGGFLSRTLPDGATDWLLRKIGYG